MLNAELPFEVSSQELSLGALTMDVNVDENLKLLVEVLGKQIPFGQLLGLTPDSFDTENDCIRFPWRDTLIGHPICKLLHGGAISSILDIQGSFMVLLEQIRSSNFKASGKGGTIDLRVDYLLPGKGRHFVTSGNILRMGEKSPLPGWHYTMINTNLSQ